MSRCGSVTLEGKQLSTVFLLSRVASLPRESGISSNRVGFIPSQTTDLVEKATKFGRILSLFLGLPDSVTMLRFVIPHTVCEPTFFAMLKIGLTTEKPNKKQTARVCSLFGLPDRIRTYGLKSRSLVHYPAMLPVERHKYILPHFRDFFNRKMSYFASFLFYFYRILPP